MGPRSPIAAPLPPWAGPGCIDWAQPWLEPWRALGEPLADAVGRGQALHEALNAARAVQTHARGSAVLADLRFVPQADLPVGQAYEHFIFNSKQCPVREGLHDFFNGLCWLQFPQTKARLNALQAEHIAQHGVQAQRGPLRDALTLFDENAAVLIADPATAAQLWPALLAKDWQRLLVDLRPLWQRAQLLLFGHALLEKLVNPRKALTTHVFTACTAITSVANADAHIAASLHAHELARKPFAPLPVLGVPGWWPDNQEPQFYNDPKVFRAAT